MRVETDLGRNAVGRMGDVGWRMVAGDVKRSAKWWVSRRSRRAQEELLRTCKSPDDFFAFSKLLGPFSQRPKELLAFVEILRAARPQWILEIGSCCGHTMFMLNKMLPEADIIGIDLFVRNRFLLRHFADRKRLHIINGPSTDRRSLKRVERILAGRRLDALFIDGDHNYEGVAKDFLAYRHLMKDGGLIALHDIQPDGRAEGRQTRAWVGGVPDLWSRLRPLYAHRELIARPDQQGFGIGVLWYAPGVTPPVDLAVAP